MTTKRCSGRSILARWFSLKRFPPAWLSLLPAVFSAAALAAPAPVSGLESLAKAYHDAPTPAHRAALERYAAAHPKDQNGALARLALGVMALQQKDYSKAVPHLEAARPRLPKLADYVGYYLGSARVGNNDFGAAAKDLAEAGLAPIPSPLASKALVLGAQALVSAKSPQEAVKVLRGRYSELNQPDGAFALGTAYEAAGELGQAAIYYQQVYYRYPTVDLANDAGTALDRMRQSLGAGYPPVMPQMLLARADAWMAARDYRRAQADYSSLIPQLGGLDRDRARVGALVAQYLGGNPSQACAQLRSLELNPSDADAQRQYYLVECARRMNQDEEMAAAVKRISKSYGDSPWRFRALVTAGNRYLLSNQPEEYAPYFRAAAEDFPRDPQASTYHWRVVWSEYIRRKRDAGKLLKEHLDKFAGQATTGAAIYFLGRLAEKDEEYADARTYYTRLTRVFPNYYYAMLARKRLTEPKLVAAGLSKRVTEYLDGLSLAERRSELGKPAAATSVRIERATLLKTAGFADLAEGELRFGLRRDPQPGALALELARYDDSPKQRMRYMKSAAPEYLTVPLDGASPRVWELLFPMPYQAELRRNAKAQNLDPYIVAGLIRQESEFDTRAVSRANAYGLTQVRPGTARQLARHVGLRRVNTAVLFQPAANLKLGTYYLRTILDQWGGKWEPTLASYNAGKSRVDNWITWAQYEEPAEFVESIPFTETREYVQAVLRNAEVYRRLYQARADGEPVTKTKAPVRKAAPKGKARKRTRA
jgi:soluble lytic murein transglycosylase